jgi:hypothetical protein
MRRKVSHSDVYFFSTNLEICEDTLARLSVYTVPSAASSYTALLPHFLPPRTSLPHTLVMIVLDWTRPWTFVEELQMWLKWVEKWAKGDGSRELEIIREESRERCKFQTLFLAKKKCMFEHLLQCSPTCSITQSLHPNNFPPLPLCPVHCFLSDLDLSHITQLVFLL